MRILKEDYLPYSTCPEYDKYLDGHLNGVKEAFNQFRNLSILDPVVDDQTMTATKELIDKHDSSKFGIEEYDAYANYFYRERGSQSADEKFNFAWNHHIHHNPHHWQYWVLINDEDEPKINPLDMPIPYIIEMLCDWNSFSKKDPNSTADKWYEKNKENMILSSHTKYFIERLLPYFSSPVE